MSDNKNEWSELEKWGFSLVKLVIVAVLSLFFLDKCAFNWQTDLLTKGEALRDFLNAATIYERTTYAAFNYIFLEKSETHNPDSIDYLDRKIVGQWHNDIFPNVQAPINRLEILFDDQEVKDALEYYCQLLDTIKIEERALKARVKNEGKTHTDSLWKIYRCEELKPLLDSVKVAHKRVYKVGISDMKSIKLKR